MITSVLRTVFLSGSSALLLAASLSAQEKSAPIVLLPASTPEATKAAFAGAVEEAINFGGVTRTEPRMKALLDASPDFALGRAIYGGLGFNMTAADRAREIETALKSAANAPAGQVLFILALREWRAGRTPLARELLDLAIKQAPDDPLPQWLRLNLATTAEGLQLGEATIRKFPDYAANYNTYAYRLNTAGRKDEAFRMIQKYVELLPSHPNSHDSYAELLQLNGRYDEAVPHYQQALTIDPNFEAAHEGLAEIAVARGNYAEARQHLERALALVTFVPRRLVLQRGLAATYLYEGKLKEAQTIMTEVVRTSETNSINALQDKRWIAFMLAADGKAAEATAQYNASIPPTPPPAFPFNDVIFHGMLRHPAEVAKALAAYETHAAGSPGVMDTQEALRTARVIHAAVNNDLATARAGLQQISNPASKALAASFVVQAARKAKDQVTAKAALADVEANKTLNLNAGLTRYYAQRAK